MLETLKNIWGLTPLGAAYNFSKLQGQMSDAADNAIDLQKPELTKLAESANSGVKWALIIGGAIAIILLAKKVGQKF
jgi:hypothetical protein